MARIVARTPLVSPVELGFGQDIWMLSPEQITRILFIFFVEEITYAIIISATKASVILFYLRIFPEPWFRTACRVILFVSGIFGLWHIFQILFVCWPMDYNWKYWDSIHKGTLFSFINAGINIALDLSLCVLPVTQL
ncbi:hypothetical protein LX32DRAFT_719021 [Colletotrichum zoysiae]|uniref:Rhodopsin domain-containing protein n=1 Tax=Colletotrichum zoysiae TaxID=1216348 RepID=A0AAD9M515_9PEZI|nr:hypothetical protein LX32DRAFT_719021 [Colletotrichum zoysiae]